MSDMMEAGHSWLADQSALYKSAAITYASGVYSVTVRMQHQRKTFQVDNGMGGIEESVRHDWTVKASELIINGSAHTPVRGDTVTDAAGNVYEVVGDGAGKQPYEQSDPYGYQIRIHSVRKTIG